MAESKKQAKELLNPVFPKKLVLKIEPPMIGVVYSRAKKEKKVKIYHRKGMKRRTSIQQLGLF